MRVKKEESNLRRSKIDRKGKKQKLRIEGKNKTIGLSKWAKGNKQEKQRKILFWNIADVGEKDLDFWSYVKGYDFVSLCEAWLNENVGMQ